MGGDDPGGLGASVAGDDGPGPVLPGGQGLVVPGRAPLGAGPHRPPRPRVSGRVPHRLTTLADVPLLGAAASFGDDGVDELPVDEGVFCPVQGGPQDRLGRAPDGSQAVNLSWMSSSVVRLAAESMPAPGDDDELGDAVSGLEGLHHAGDRGGLGPVALPAPDSQGEPASVDQRPDDDLGVAPVFFGVADLA